MTRQTRRLVSCAPFHRSITLTALGRSFLCLHTFFLLHLFYSFITEIQSSSSEQQQQLTKK